VSLASYEVGVRAAEPTTVNVDREGVLPPLPALLMPALLMPALLMPALLLPAPPLSSPPLSSPSALMAAMMRYVRSNWW
jgi:hypothetical protein